MIYSVVIMKIRNISKKFTYFNIKHKIKRIILKMGENDYYPQFPKPKYSILSNYQRYKFWNNLAKKHTPFKYFYEKNPGKYFEENSPIPDDHKYFNPLRKFYQNGVCEIENFFDEIEHGKICDFFAQNTLKNIEKIGRQNIICRDEEINTIVYDKTKNLEYILFGKYLKKQNYSTQTIFKKKDENSLFGTSVLFHSDRFIPSIKLIYFPTEVKIDPFEYVLGSHKIDEIFEKKIFIENKFEKEMGKKLRKEVLNKKIDTKTSDYEDILVKNFDFKKYIFKKFYCKANTLLIVATHGLHRRSQTLEKEICGVRNNLTISYYNEFTRYDLLKKIYN